MRDTCDNVARMAKKMIQIRNVPESTHRTLKVRAAQAGVSLSDYLLAEVRRMAEMPTIAELSARIAARTRAAGSSAGVIRRHRDAS